MKETKKPFTKEYSFIEYEPGDFVWIDGFPNPGLDTERIYQVESFIPPTDPPQVANGTVKLRHRPTPVNTSSLKLATEENFRNAGFTDPEKLKFFLEYLEWLQKEDRFGD